MQSHLLQGEAPPVCHWCQETVTVLITFPSFQSIYQQCFVTAGSLFSCLGPSHRQLIFFTSKEDELNDFLNFIFAESTRHPTQEGRSEGDFDRS